mmetsp:Transcript_42586/g.103385  ORF Transcript_42586/g.103385 Transcript_42586/m.103385 type:complete len:270 (-) Transcript_42586:678-1487(-)
MPYEPRTSRQRIAACSGSRASSSHSTLNSSARCRPAPFLSSSLCSGRTLERSSCFTARTSASASAGTPMGAGPPSSESHSSASFLNLALKLVSCRIASRAVSRHSRSLGAFSSTWRISRASMFIGSARHSATERSGEPRPASTKPSPTRSSKSSMCCCAYLALLDHCVRSRQSACRPKGGGGQGGSSESVPGATGGHDFVSAPLRSCVLFRGINARACSLLIELQGDLVGGRDAEETESEETEEEMLFPGGAGAGGLEASVGRLSCTPA